MKKSIFYLSIIAIITICYFSFNKEEDKVIIKSIAKPVIRPNTTVENKPKIVYALVSPKSPYFKIENNSIVQVLNYDRTSAYTRNDFIKVKVIKPILNYTDKYILVECSDSRYATSYFIVSKDSIIYLTND